MAVPHSGPQLCSCAQFLSFGVNYQTGIQSRRMVARVRLNGAHRPVGAASVSAAEKGAMVRQHTICEVQFESTGRVMWIGDSGPAIALSAFRSLEISSHGNPIWPATAVRSDNLESAELAELVDHMIRRWQALKSSTEA
jgi:hypothetical protein